MSFMPNKNDWEYEPDSLGRLGRGEWRRKPGATAFAAEEDDSDPAVAAMRRAFRNGNEPDIFDDTGRVRLDQPVGRNQPNQRADVARVELALHRAGFYDVNGTGGPTGWYGPPQDEAIKSFQKAGALDDDGFLLKDGPTANALGAAPAAKKETETHTEPWLDEDGVRHAPDNQVAFAQVLGPVIQTAPSWAPAAGAAIGSAVVGILGAEALKKGGKAAQDFIDEQIAQGRDLGQMQPTARSPFFPIERRSLLDVQERRDIVPPGPIIFPGAPIKNEKPEPFVTPKAEPLPPLPPFTFPKDTKPEDWIEIFPDQSDFQQKLFPIVVPRFGSEKTKIYNTDVLKCLLDAGGEGFSRAGGGYKNDDKVQYDSELYLRPSGTPPGTRKNGSYLDVAIKHDNGRLLVNTYDPYADGSPTRREANAAIRILKNKDGKDTLLLIPKLRNGETLNCDALAEFAKPLLDEIRKGNGSPVESIWKPGG